MQRRKRSNRSHMACWLAVLLLAATAGGCGSPLSWETRQEQIEITSDGIQAVSLKTHNGKIHVSAVDDADALIEVTATIEGGASSAEEVRECLDAIEIVVSDADSATLEVFWRWRDGQRSGWSAKVSFDVVVPSRLGVEAETHNGAIDVNGVEGDCRLKSQNGRIRSLADGPALRAETHNGGLFVQTAATDVVLVTHNGSIDAVLKSNDMISGNVKTHNVNPLCSTKISGRTKNGRITSTLPLEEEDSNRKSITGQMGTGSGTLTVSTHNGSISLRATDVTPVSTPTGSSSAEAGESSTSDRDASDD